MDGTTSGGLASAIWESNGQMMAVNLEYIQGTGYVLNPDATPYTVSFKAGSSMDAMQQAAGSNLIGQVDHPNPDDVYPISYVPQGHADNVQIFAVSRYDGASDRVDYDAGIFIKDMNGDVVGPLTKQDGTQYTQPGGSSSVTISSSHINDWHTDSGAVSLSDTPSIGYVGNASYFVKTNQTYDSIVYPPLLKLDISIDGLQIYAEWRGDTQTDGYYIKNLSGEGFLGPLLNHSTSVQYSIGTIAGTDSDTWTIYDGGGHVNVAATYPESMKSYWNAYADGPIGRDEAIQYVSTQLDSEGGYEITDLASLIAGVDSGTGQRDYVNTLGLESADFGGNVINTGSGSDVIGGGQGGYSFDGGAGFDLFIPSYVENGLEKVYDSDNNVISQNGVFIELSSNKVTYLGLDGKSDEVENIEWFLGTTGDDIFIGSARYDSEYLIQSFNPSGGRDEIFGAEDLEDLDGNLIEVLTAVDYSVMQGGQGVVFILSETSDAVNVDVPYLTNGTNISDDSEGYWNNWLPSNDTIVNKDGFISATSEYDTDKNGATVILDSFGDVDIAFNIDHYIGSDEADLFFGSNEDDIFDAGMGAGNFMSGDDGKDELIVSGEDFEAFDIDQSTLTVGRVYNSNEEFVSIGSTEIATGSGSSLTGATSVRYQVDFADVYDLNMFIGDNLSAAISGNYTQTTEYTLYLETEATFQQDIKVLALM